MSSCHFDSVKKASYDRITKVFASETFWTKIILKLPPNCQQLVMVKVQYKKVYLRATWSRKFVLSGSCYEEEEIANWHGSKMFKLRCDQKRLRRSSQILIRDKVGKKICDRFSHI